MDEKNKTCVQQTLYAGFALEHRNTIDAIAVCEISETVSAFRSVTSIQLPDFFYPMVADQRLHHLLGAGV